MSPWGIVLAGLAWFLTSCLFSVCLGRIIAKFANDADADSDSVHAERPRRHNPQRVVPLRTRREQQGIKRTHSG